MMPLAALLSLIVGAALGALGGGGSILMVPILVYVVGVAPRDAIAMSLLVVGFTAAAATLARVRAGEIQWRIGALFGSAAMIGAFSGGKLATYMPVSILLVVFALLMIATAIVMLRRGDSHTETATCGQARLRVGPALVTGAVVGVTAGLVGAGGGFLVVPALVLFGGLRMRAAIATSLLVITMQSVAGLLGHLGKLQIDWRLGALLTAFAIAGSMMGGHFAARLPQRALRRGFAWFVGSLGLLMLALQLPASWRAALISADLPWMPLLGGALIGGAAAMFWLLNGRIAGISGIVGGLPRAPGGDRAWRALFLMGLVCGGVLMNALAPASFETGTSSYGVLIVAGLLVGVGTTLANGCTSGHGVCGVSRLSPRSFIATGAFMSAGMLVVYLAQHVTGALR